MRAIPTNARPTPPTYTACSPHSHPPTPRRPHARRHGRPPGPSKGSPPPQGPVMTYIAKPKFHHPGLPKNDLGFPHRDYEGKISTLCAGCGHDSITASIIEACYELSIE